MESFVAGQIGDLLEIFLIWLQASAKGLVEMESEATGSTQGSEQVFQAGLAKHEGAQFHQSSTDAFLQGGC